MFGFGSSLESSSVVESAIGSEVGSEVRSEVRSEVGSAAGSEVGRGAYVVPHPDGWYGTLHGTAREKAHFIRTNRGYPDAVSDTPPKVNNADTKSTISNADTKSTIGNADTKSTISYADYPNHIRVRGLPFMLQGWNTTFYKTEKLSEGCPIYRLDGYKLYFLIDIVGVTIKMRNGKWCFTNDWHWTVDENKNLLGKWNAYNMSIGY